jgi:predicted nucleic acid-binding protein
MADVSRRTGLTAYDAAFLWLAERLDLDLISLDARLNAAKRK